jgi:hypothetical protein
VPYAGPRDGGASIFNSYAQGAHLKMARRESVERKKLQDAQLELAQAAQAEQKRQFDARYLQDANREERYARESDQRTLLDQTQERRAQTSFNQSQEDRATKRRERDSLDKATEFVGGMDLDTVSQVFPDMQADVDAARKAIDALGDLSPTARGLAATKAADILHQKVEMRGHKAAMDAFNDAEATGGLSDTSGTSEAGSSLRAMMSDPKVPWATKLKTLVGFQKEAAGRKAKTEIQQRGGQRLREQFLGTVAHVAHGSPEEDEINHEITSVEQGLQTYQEARRNINGIIDPKEKAGTASTGPKVSDQIALAKELRGDSMEMPFEDAWAKAGEILNPKPKVAPSSDEQFIQGWRGKNPGASPGEEEAAMAGWRGGAPGAKPKSEAAPAKGETAQTQASDADKIAWRDQWKAAHPNATREELAAALKAQFPDLK